MIQQAIEQLTNFWLQIAGASLLITIILSFVSKFKIITFISGVVSAVVLTITAVAIIQPMTYFSMRAKAFNMTHPKEQQIMDLEVFKERLKTLEKQLR